MILFLFGLFILAVVVIAAVVWLLRKVFGGSSEYNSYPTETYVTPSYRTTYVDSDPTPRSSPSTSPWTSVSSDSSSSSGSSYSSSDSGSSYSSSDSGSSYGGGDSGGGFGGGDSGGGGSSDSR